MSAIAIIAARGGSKRIPRKNVREFAGKPMIAWSIATALESRLFDHVIVSTEDAEIAAVAAEAGAEVPFIRPAELADDRSGTLEVVAHAAYWARTQNWQFDRACCLYGTSVFTTPEDLQRAQVRLDGWDYVIAAGRFPRAPQRAFARSHTGAMELLQPAFTMTRSQDLPPAYYDAGQFYWGRAEAWIERRSIHGERTTFIELSPDRAIDIDTSDDWMIAELQFNASKR